MTFKERIRATENEIAREAAARRAEFQRKQTERELQESRPGGVACRLGSTSCRECIFFEPVTWHCLYRRK